MNTLSDQTKHELFHALNGKQSSVFIVNGKLVSVEIEDQQIDLQKDLGFNALSQEIEEYPDLKESLSRYLDNPHMKRYTGSELKAKRHEKRKE